MYSEKKEQNGRYVNLPLDKCKWRQNKLYILFEKAKIACLPTNFMLDTCNLKVFPRARD